MNNDEIKIENVDEPARENDDSDLTYVDSTEDGEALPTKDVVKKLRADLNLCRKEKEDYLIGWQRAKADYINLQKELDLARVNISILTKQKMVEKLLPAFDSFEMAFANKEAWEKVDSNWRGGMESIYQQCLAGLINSGIDTISDSNIPFDPNIHQSISIIDTKEESKDHTVERVLQVGYKIGDRVVRPAKVTIYEFKK